MTVNSAGSSNTIEICCRCRDLHPVADMRIWKPTNIAEISSAQWICTECEGEYAKEGIYHADDRR